MHVCEYHTDCTKEVVGRIKLPRGAVDACLDAINEFKSLWSVRSSTHSRVVNDRPSRLGDPDTLTQDQIDKLKLTSREIKELAGMPEQERNEVLAYLVKAQVTT